MSNNIWDFNSPLSNHDAQSRPNTSTVQASSQSYHQPLLGNPTHIAYIHESPVLPTEIASTTTRRLNILHQTVMISPRGLIFRPSQAHQTTNNSGVRRPFLRMPSQHVLVMMPATANAQPTRLASLAGAMAVHAMPPGSDIQAPSQEMNNTVVVTQTQVPQIDAREEEESESDGTQPYINLLDHPIQNDEFVGLVLNAPDANDDGNDLNTDLTLNL